MGKFLRDSKGEVEVIDLFKSRPVGYIASHREALDGIYLIEALREIKNRGGFDLKRHGYGYIPGPWRRY